MTESEAFELGNKLYANITSNANNIIKTNYYINFVIIAINALEKQIPKKPDLTEDKEFALCPCCNGKGLFNKQKYCDNCGQAIDWSDEERVI